LCLFVLLEDERDTIEPHRDEHEATMRALSSKVDDLRTCSDLVTKHSAALQKALVDLQKGGTSPSDTVHIIRTVNERATLFRITTTAMIGVSE